MAEDQLIDAAFQHRGQRHASALASALVSALVSRYNCTQYMIAFVSSVHGCKHHWTKHPRPHVHQANTSFCYLCELL